LDVQCDVFALGAVLYALLTGHPPFDSPHDDEALKLAQRCKFDKAALEAAAPRPLAAVCLKAMSAAPADRHSSVEQLAAELEAFARPRHSRRWWLAAAGLLAAGAGLAAWMAWPEDEPPPEVDFQNLMQVQRTKDVRGMQDTELHAVQDFPKALPVKQGDTLSIEARLPHGLRATIIWYKSEGVFNDAATMDNTGLRDEEDAMVVVWPSAGPETPTAEGTTGEIISGTDFVLVCGDEARPSREEIEAIVRSVFDAKPLRELPDNVAVVLKPGGVDKRVRSPNETARGPALAEVEAKLDQLRQRLSDRYPFFVGVAFPVRPPLE
jgi:hypothetical protein